MKDLENNEAMKKEFFPHTLFQFLTILGLALIPMVILILIMRDYIQEGGFSFLFYLLYSFIVIAIVFLVNWRNKVPLSFNLKLTHLHSVLIVAACITVFQIGLNAPISEYITSYFQPISISSNPFDSPLLWIGALFVAPIVEELIYRGILLKCLLLSYKPKRAILLSAIIFSIIHLSIYQLFGAFCLGLLLSFLYYKWKSLGVLFILHSIYNLAGLVSDVLKYTFSEQGCFIYGTYTPFVVLMALLLLVLMLILCRKKRLFCLDT